MLLQIEYMWRFGMIERWRFKLAGFTFLGLTAAISVNALYLQGAGPTEGAASAPSPATVQSIGSLSGAPKAAIPAEAPRAAVSLEIIKGVQRELARRGYRVGSEDGRIRIITREAIIAYEFDRGLALTGEPSETLLKDMIFAPVPAKAERTRSEQRFEADARLVRRVQQLLADLGFGSPAASGAMDDATRAALRQFQTNRKLAVDGALNERVLLELYVVTGKPIALSA
jgi:peptidoglycan hydrolase-like protein with peptidoglycan-binding domain